AVALERELLAAVDPNLDARGLEAPPRLRVPVEGERHPRAEREHVAAERGVLLVRDLHELDSALLEKLEQPNRRERRVDEREVAVERADEREQVEHLARPAAVREIEREVVDVRERSPQRPRPRLVRPAAPAGGE